ncbi:S-layer homology domain-containing protein, partial [Oscillospiraceae bacterium OttesenSCG-928-F05]|nr:S-layer homology domain-containing protein [Oscillospiraceae bacterium OttesenSCG-928-F05]
NWSNTSVSTMASAGVLKGYPDGTFGPGRQITRAEFAAIVSRLYPRDSGGERLFGDTAGHWGEAEINKVAGLGWINGYPDGTFRPDAAITRAEVTAIVNRLLIRRVGSEEDFCEGMTVWPDNRDSSKWYYLDIQEASNSHDYVWDKERNVGKWTGIIDAAPLA